MTTSIQEVKRQIAQARQSVQEQKELIEQKRQEAREVESKISEQERKLPLPSQARLRGGLYSGLEGRKRRQQILGIKQELEGRKKEVGLFKKGLSEYETGVLDPYEKEISTTQAQVSAYERKVKDYEQGYKLGLKGVADPDMNKEMRQGYSDARQNIKATESETQSSGSNASVYPSPPVSDSIISLGLPKLTFKERAEQTGGFVSVNDPYVFGSGAPKEVKIAVRLSSLPRYSFKKSSFSLPSVPRDLSRTDLKKDWAKVSSFDISSTSTDKLFRTTGSPLRVTKLTDLKSRGYIPDKKPVLVKPSFVRKPKSSPSKIKSKKTGFSFWGDGSLLVFKKSKKPKKNIWGF